MKEVNIGVGLAFVAVIALMVYWLTGCHDPISGNWKPHGPRPNPYGLTNSTKEKL